MERKSKRLAKVIMLGDTGVGKTCFLTRFVNDAFSEAGISNTAGVLFAMTTVEVNGQKIQLNLVTNM